MVVLTWRDGGLEERSAEGVAFAAGQDFRAF